MTYLRYQQQLFFIALGFFTRIPVPTDLDYSQEKLNRASRYFPLVGWLIGAITAVTFIVANHWFSNSVAVLLAMGIGFLLTGAFHEDGLADTADGLGGGWTIKQKLSIMKDSRLGSYGALVLWFTLTLKFTLLTEIENVGLALLVAHPMSRAVSSCLIYCLNYVTEDAQAKVKPLAETQATSDLMISLAFGLGALVLVLPQAIVVLLSLIVVTLVYGLFLKRQIGGFTGDTLGAAQQISELTIYLVLVSTGPITLSNFL